MDEDHNVHLSGETVSEVRTEVKNNKSVKQTSTLLHTELTGGNIKDIFAHVLFIYTAAAEGMDRKNYSALPFTLFNFSVLVISCRDESDSHCSNGKIS